MEPEAPRQPRAILVVEDEEAHAELIRRAFDEANRSRYLVTLARTLRQAGDCVDAEVPELIIADLLLPDGKGTELVAHPKVGGQIPLIVMTSHGNEQTAVDALKGGAFDYVVKSDQAFLNMPRTADQALREWGHIVERTRAEQELREREVELYAIYENAPLIMMLVDAERRVRKANVAAAVFADRTASDLIGRRGGEALRCAHSLDTPEGCGFGPACKQCQVRLTIMDTLENGNGRYQMEASLPFSVQGKAQELWFLLSSTRLNVRGQPMVLASILDITARKQAEKALGESEERFRAVFESAEDCIFIADQSLRYTHVNSATCQLLGLPPSKIVGRRAEDLYDEGTAKQLTERETRALAGESTETEQTRSVRGTPLTFHDTLVPLKNQAHEIIGVCCISRDVTGRKKLVGHSRITPDQYPSEAMRRVLSKARMAAETDSVLLLQGESGSGKDYLARWIHERSRRASGPYFSINCAALPKDLAESELFGHERGAFTGAVGLKKGLLELAEGGTILLNEIGELDLGLQAKLLAFLDTRSFLRVGGQKHIRVNARIVSASHRDLSHEVAEGRFLEALFYRLSVFPIFVPALRERPEDMPMLVDEIMARLATELQLDRGPVINQDHLTRLNLYTWPGNVRELRNVLERSLILWDGGEFNLALPQTGANNGEWSYTVRYVPGKSLREVTDEVESSLCEQVLMLCGGNKKETARALDISRDTLYRHIRVLKRNAEK